MHDLAPLAPLGAPEPQVDRIGDVTISEIVDRSLASVSSRMGREEEFSAAAEAFFGVELPEPGEWAAGEAWGLIWTSPGQWFAEADFASHEMIAAEVKAALGENASVTEQTDAWARFRIEGGGTVAMLQRLTMADSAAMKSGQATRTAIEHLGCLLICRKAGMSFDILCPRSSAASLHHALTGAARSVA